MTEAIVKDYWAAELITLCIHNTSPVEADRQPHMIYELVEYLLERGKLTKMITSYSNNVSPSSFFFPVANERT